MKARDVPSLYWLGASWALAISNAKTDISSIGDLAVVETIMQRAFSLDPTYDEGVLYAFYVSFIDAKTPAEQQKLELYKRRAEQLSGGHRLGVLVAYAENVLVAKQNKKEFMDLLNRVVQTDVYSEQPQWKKNRLQNILAQKRAEWLLGRLSVLFVD